MIRRAMIHVPNRRQLGVALRRFLARRGWLVRQPSGGESRDVWQVGPLCVKRWQRAVKPATVRAKCRLSRCHADFARRWYLPWLHWSIGPWIKGRQANFQECNALAYRHPWARDLNPSNVLATPRGLRIIDYEVVAWPSGAFRPSSVRRFAQRIWDLIRIARLPGGGESRDIWKLGPLCIKRWSPRVTPSEVRERCRVSRQPPLRGGARPVCNPMWYVPWFHWTLSCWVHGQPATHAACNNLLAAHLILRDLHPGNVLTCRNGPVVVDFTVSRRQAAMPIKLGRDTPDVAFLRPMASPRGR